MRARNLPAVGIGVVALIVSATTGGTANAQQTQAPRATAVAQAPAQSLAPTAGTNYIAKKKKGCKFDQLTNVTDGLNGVTSQNFYDAGFASHSADDFMCKGKKKKTITLKSVTVQSYPGYGIVDPKGANVTVYMDDGGTPGEPDDNAIVCQAIDASVTNPTTNIYKATIPASAGCTVQKGTRYWMEVQADQSLSSYGQFFWEVATDTIGPEWDFSNPDGTFPPCVAYNNGTTGQACIGLTGTPSLMFAVK